MEAKFMWFLTPPHAPPVLAIWWTWWEKETFAFAGKRNPVTQPSLGLRQAIPQSACTSVTTTTINKTRQRGVMSVQLKQYINKKTRATSGKLSS